MVPRGALAHVVPSVQPLEVGAPSIDLDVQESRRLAVQALSVALTDGAPQFSGRFLSENRVHVLQVLPEEPVEQVVLGAGVGIAEPPEPIASLGDRKLLPGVIERFLPTRPVSVTCWRWLRVWLSRSQGAVAFGMADPDTEVVLDPTAGEEVRQFVGGRMLFQVVANSDGRDIGVTCHPTIERLEEIDAAARIVFPAVLAIENDAHQGGAVSRVAAGCMGDRLHLGQEIVHGMLGLITLVMEADLVAHSMIAEDHLQGVALLFHAPRPIEHLRISQVAVAVARGPIRRWNTRGFLRRWRSTGCRPGRLPE